MDKEIKKVMIRNITEMLDSTQRSLSRDIDSLQGVLESYESKISDIKLQIDKLAFEE